MALDAQRLRLTNDHTLESASEIMSQLQFERRIPNGRDAYLQVLLRNLGFRSDQDGVEYKQFVFQGQCLILGDARAGKTSLKKSLMGKPFDADEPGTKGVELSLVDRKWRNLHALAGLKFGSFTRFRESALYRGVIFGPGGVEIIIDEEVTSAVSAIADFVFMLLRIGWLLSVIWLLAFGTVTVSFYAFSIAVLFLEVLLQRFLPSDRPEFASLALLIVNLPRFIIGLGTAHLFAGLFRGIDCQNLNSSLDTSMSNGVQFMWFAHLLIVAMLVNGISAHFFILMGNYFREANIWGRVESAVPGQILLNFQQLRRALHDMFSSLKLKILDFSGDEEYYAYHHIFLRDQAIYIVVFNMANFADDNFRNVAAKIERLTFWLESICSKAASKTPIFLVGTHRGHMDKTYLKRIDKHLRQNLLDSFNDELVRNEEDSLLYFPIENSQGKNDRGVQNLQRKLMSTAEEHKTTMGREIPFSWIKIQDAIINLRENKKAKFCVTMMQFPISVGNFICSNWSKETLKYFHEKGLVIYVDPGQDSELSNWILLKPEILIDIIIQLVTPPKDDEDSSQHGFRRDFKLLHNTGMLTKPLLKKFLSRWQENEEAMKGFLEEYDIICPLFYNVENKEEGKVTHFVPSLLPVSVSGNTPVWHNDPTDKKFFVFFKRFLPEPLFHHLLSRAHRHSTAGFPKGQPVIYRDVGRFWFTPSQPYRLLILKEENMIEVTFSYRDRQDMNPSDVLSLVFSMVQGICQRHFPYVTFHCGPACPSEKCPGHQGDYISHPGVQQSSSRPHVFNVLPARQEDSISSFYCVNRNFENDLKDWLL
ncbi:hypothetical protein ACROYT_G008333 [Oculina patagonica]